jgi:hypothetical protein
MTLQTLEPHFLPGEHARICRAVRFMASGAAFEPHRRVFVGERTPLVAVAFEAAGFVPRNGLDLLGPETAVWIMAVDAGHRAFVQVMAVGTLELGPGVHMAGSALAIDGGCFAGDERFRAFVH